MKEQLSKSTPEYARNLFAKASGQYSASVTAQGIFIALDCKKHRLRPMDLMESLLRDDNCIDDLVSQAKNAHLAIPEKMRPIVDKDSVIRIIKSDFLLASRFIVLEEEELKQSLSTGYDFHVRDRKHLPPLLRNISEESFKMEMLTLAQQENSFSFNKLIKMLKKMISRS